MFDLLGFFSSLFGHKTPSTPTPFQHVVDEAGSIIDTLETSVTALQSLSPSLPAPFQGYLAALALAVHGIDAFVDSVETQPGTDPAPMTISPTGVASTTTVLGK